MNASGRWAVLDRRTRVVAMTLLVASCGIDQGGYDGPSVQNQRDQTVLVSGPIDAFGSVHVNGLALDTSRAQIRVDGLPASQADLRLGQMIRAVALVGRASAAALSIDYEENVVGPVASVDATAGELIVLGQRVRVTASTRFETPALTSVGDLTVGDRVAVSGITAPGNTVLATYVARAAVTEPFEITAAITAVGPAAFVFELGALEVDYSRAVLLELPAGMPAANVVVEVTGSTLANGVLIAERVRALPLIPGGLTASATALTSVEVPAVASAALPQPEAVRFVGVIAARGASSIGFGDFDVRLTQATIVTGGSATQLVVGARVMVEGEILGAGRVEATRIEIQ
jgi:hypothetical protein